MKTLIRKELRENFIVAVVAFVIFTFCMVVAYHNRNLSSSDPLLAVPSAANFLCAIFGAVLGWLQIHNERHPDLWAFLIHRPVPRARILMAKVIAGLCLYSLGAGLPFLGLLVMVRIPGHIAAPFEWGMVLPFTAFFLAGIVYYFAGILTGVRQARWYLSRGLGLGVGIVVSVAITFAPEFWQALVLILVGGTIVALAAWGSFMSHGYYRGQPASGQRMLVVSLTVGCSLVVFIVMAVLEALLPQPTQHGYSSSYQMTRDGSIYINKQPVRKPAEIADLNGVTLKGAKTGRPITWADLDYPLAYGCEVRPEYEDQAQYQKRHQESYLQTSHYFNLWRQTPDTLWYWTWNGRLLAYDIASSRFLGSLGPDGFSPDQAAGVRRFSRPGIWTLMTDTAVYQIDLEKRAASVLFATTNGERIGGAADFSARGYGDYTIVATRRSIQLLTADGKQVWQIPYEPAYPTYWEVAVNFLEPTNRFAVWFRPSDQTNRIMNWTLPTHVVWLSAGQGMLGSTNLPALTNRVEWTRLWGRELFNSAQPPAVYFITPLVYGRTPHYTTVPWNAVRLSMVAAIVCAVVGWVLGRRYHFGVGAQVKWAVFHLVFGVPGLLAFLCVQEWPARQTCPNCKKPRLVDREQCEFCGAAFAPPPKNGTEIFETIGAMPRPPG